MSEQDNQHQIEVWVVTRANYDDVWVYSVHKSNEDACEAVIKEQQSEDGRPNWARDSYKVEGPFMLTGGGFN